MAISKKKGITLFTLGGILVGIGLGWLIFSPKKPQSLVGTACTKDGKTGVTQADGSCKVV